MRTRFVGEYPFVCVIPAIARSKSGYQESFTDLPMAQTLGVLERLLMMERSAMPDRSGEVDVVGCEDEFVRSSLHKNEKERGN